MVSPSEAYKRASIASISTVSSTTSAASSTTTSTFPTSRQQQPPLPRRDSSVQLIPHSHSRTYFDSPLTPSEHSLIAASESNFNDLDLSSQDFDFDDVFTFDRPHRKIPRVVEVSSPSRMSATQQQRDWSNFSFSHYGNGPLPQGNPKVKVSQHHQHQGHYRLKPGMAGMQRELGLGIGAAYLRNQQLQLKGRR